MDTIDYDLYVTLNKQPDPKDIDAALEIFCPNGESVNWWLDESREFCVDAYDVETPTDVEDMLNKTITTFTERGYTVEEARLTRKEDLHVPVVAIYQPRTHTTIKHMCDRDGDILIYADSIIDALNTGGEQAVRKLIDPTCSQPA